jgi:predicted SprT family Zn-dependent metalloprotease
MISLTPMHLNRDLKLVFGTLVHEMCHLWQQDFGKPSKNGYHNKEWAEKMKEVGLHPSNTGDEGGKETGQKVTHYILDGGRFDEVFKNIPDHISLPWIGAGMSEKKKAVRNKVKYSCPVCEANVWGKPDMNITCGDCDQVFEEQ